MHAAHPDVPSIWSWFEAECREPEVWRGIRDKKSLLAGHPGLPDNLFSTVNLPTARVMFKPAPDAEWDSREEDIALLFSEAAPGKVTRRYGWGHHLHWRSPRAKVDVERYKTDRQPPGPFRTDRILSLAAEWGPDWARMLPRRVAEVHRGASPAGFYRVRYMELWNFGEIDPRDPKTPQPSWRWWGRREHGGVRVMFDHNGGGLRDPWRRVSPDSSSEPLSFSHARLADVASAFALRLPPVFPGLLDRLDGYCGNDADSRAPVRVWEAHYGAEARVVLLPNGRDDDQAGTASTTVAYVGGPDEVPLLYGHDLATEGVAAPFDRNRLRTAVEAVFEDWWNDGRRRSHLQDQFLRHILKMEPWPAVGADPPLNVFEVRLATDVLCTMRAETRAAGDDVAAFLARLADSGPARALMTQLRSHYWRDSRRVTDEFADRLLATLAAPEVRRYLEAVFARLTSREQALDYLAATAVHSLKHAVRRLFTTEGFARDEEVGSTAVLPFTHGHWDDEARFYVFERNAGGNGATRLLAEAGLRPPGYMFNRWREHSLGCPVGQEEDFVRTAFARAGDRLVAFAREFLSTPPRDRPSPEPLLADLLPDVVDDEVALGRLAGIVTGELSLAGEAGIPVAALHRELQRLEDELAEHFQRHPIAEELAGHVATRVEHTPGDWPACAALLDVYRRRAAELGQADEPATTALERFLDQVAHLLPRTCVDACPACLAGHCQIGPIDATRHALSRRVLEALHEHLTASMTMPYRPGATTIDDLLATAEGNDGWVVLVCDRPLESALAAAVRERFDERGRVANHREFTLRLVLELRPGP